MIPRKKGRSVDTSNRFSRKISRNRFRPGKARRLSATYPWISGVPWRRSPQRPHQLRNRRY